MNLKKWTSQFTDKLNDLTGVTARREAAEAVEAKRLAALSERERKREIVRAEQDRNLQFVEKFNAHRLSIDKLRALDQGKFMTKFWIMISTLRTFLLMRGFDDLAAEVNASQTRMIHAQTTAVKGLDLTKSFDITSAAAIVKSVWFEPQIPQSDLRAHLTSDLELLALVQQSVDQLIAAQLTSDEVYALFYDEHETAESNHTLATEMATDYQTQVDAVLEISTDVTAATQHVLRRLDQLTFTESLQALEAEADLLSELSAELTELQSLRPTPADADSTADRYYHLLSAVSQFVTDSRLLTPQVRQTLESIESAEESIDLPNQSHIRTVLTQLSQCYVQHAKFITHRETALKTIFQGDHFQALHALEQVTIERNFTQKFSTATDHATTLEHQFTVQHHSELRYQTLQRFNARFDALCQPKPAFDELENDIDSINKKITTLSGAITEIDTFQAEIAENLDLPCFSDKTTDEYLSLYGLLELSGNIVYNTKKRLSDLQKQKQYLQQQVITTPLNLRYLEISKKLSALQEIQKYLPIKSDSNMVQLHLHIMSRFFAHIKGDQPHPVDSFHYWNDADSETECRAYLKSLKEFISFTEVEAEQQQETAIAELQAECFLADETYQLILTDEYITKYQDLNKDLTTVRQTVEQSLTYFSLPNIYDQIDNHLDQLSSQRAFSQALTTELVSVASLNSIPEQINVIMRFFGSQDQHSFLTQDTDTLFHKIVTPITKTASEEHTFRILLERVEMFCKHHCVDIRLHTEQALSYFSEPNLVSFADVVQTKLNDVTTQSDSHRSEAAELSVAIDSLIIANNPYFIVADRARINELIVRAPAVIQLIKLLKSLTSNQSWHSVKISFETLCLLIDDIQPPHSPLFRRLLELRVTLSPERPLSSKWYNNFLLDGLMNISKSHEEEIFRFMDDYVDPFTSTAYNDPDEEVLLWMQDVLGVFKNISRYESKISQIMRKIKNLKRKV